MMPRKLLTALLLIATAAACGGGDGDSTGAAGAGGGATAGTSNPGGSAGTTVGGTGSLTAGNPAGGSANPGGSGGSTAGGTGSGGMSGGTGTAGGAPMGAHCTPGTPQPAINFIGGTIDQCASVEGLTGTVNHISDIELSKPIGPGETFAFSVDLVAPEGDFELYGATAECGAVGEKLSTIHVTGNGIVCYQVTPSTATYSHMIWVWRVRAEMKNTAICESGMCPAK